MKKKYTTSILIFSILVTLITIALFVFFLKIIENKNKHASVVLTTLQEKMRDKENAILFAEKVAEIKTVQDSINTHFVDPNKIDTFVNYLENIGDDLGAKVVVKNIDIPAKTKNTMTFDLLVNGTFTNVMETITYIENTPYKIIITKVNLSKNVEEPIGENQDGKLKTPVPQATTWQADFSFNILSLE